jgi:dTDP-4-amino-4,6-dideoxygalactose transaminase
MTRPWIPFNRPSIGEDEKAAVLRALESGALGGNGPIGTELQKRLARLLGVKHVLLTTSCSHALELSAMALRLGQGDEIIMPSFTFVSTAAAFAREGARPVFAEIDEESLNLDPRAVEALITPATKAIVPVHYAGQGCDMDQLMAIAKRHGLWVVEDAAQALGAAYAGRPLGAFGDAGCFSFHVTKNIVCGEGGAFATNDDEIASRAEIIREKGTNRSRYLRGQVDRYTWVDLGSSFVPSDLLAALALAQLERMDEIHEKRRAIWQTYYSGLRGLESAGKLILPRLDPKARPNWHLFAFRVVDPTRRDGVLSDLRKRQIDATFHYVPLHSSPYACERWGYRTGDLEITERVSASLVRLPLYPDLSSEDQSYIIEVLREVL